VSGGARSTVSPAVERFYLAYTGAMSFSLSRRKPLDVTGVGIDQAELPPLDSGPIDLRGWFDPSRRALPLELEIGSGKGTFLVQQAMSPEGAGVNYVGVEWARAFWRYAADRVRRHHLSNVRLLHTEAGAFVRQFVAPGTFRTVHVYFPDPWPKARHHKRRLIQAPFLRELHRVLTPDGCVRLATDHSDYFTWMQEHAAMVPELFEPVPFDSPAAAGEGELVGTNFERKYRREGRPFHAMALRRLGGATA
jgi:tRNA (guanine-N7-)-methyltransferase